MQRRNFLKVLFSAAGAGVLIFASGRSKSGLGSLLASASDSSTTAQNPSITVIYEADDATLDLLLQKTSTMAGGARALVERWLDSGNLDRSVERVKDKYTIQYRFKTREHYLQFCEESAPEMDSVENLINSLNINRKIILS